MEIKLDVNSKELIALSAKLGRLRSDRFPYVVKTTLNSAAFDVKQKTMPASTKRTFTRRNKTFFKVASRVDMVRGMDVNTMVSTVGFITPRGNKNPYAVKELEQQEHGGIIKRRAYIPLNTARVSKKNRRNVRAANRLTGIKNIVKSSEAIGVNKGQRFIKSVIHAGVGGFVLSEDGILFRVNSLNRTGSGSLKLTALYSYKKDRVVRVHNQNFMQYAAEKSSKKLDQFFIKEAKKQFRKEFPI